MAINRAVCITVAWMLFASASAWAESCTDSWETTGYYTPSEEDYPGPADTLISLDGAKISVPSAFHKVVKMEGWGKTRGGWYLGYYDNDWHRSDLPLDARGKPLNTEIIAVDTGLIPLGSKVRIEGLPSPWDTRTFLANDVGGRIKSKHIDVYVGEGDAARKESYRVTGKGRRVCVLSTDM